ncbi:MAG: 50S ribosomal protein L22 [Myxococcota bacterium]
MSTREREKANRRKQARKEAPPQATLTALRMSPRKIRAVADRIEGMTVAHALSTLAFSLRAAARPLRKLISSAIANAETRGGVDLDELTVAKVQVDGGPTARRYMPRAMGRATRIRKRTSHVTVFLGTKGA